MIPLTFKYSGARVSEKAISDFEDSLHCKLPSSYRQFLLKYNGGLPSRCHFQDPLDANDYLPIEMFYHLDHTGARNDDDSDSYSLAFGIYRFKGLIPENFLPIGSVTAESVLSLRLKGNRKGQIDLNYWPELETPDGNVNARVASSFDKLLEMLQVPLV